MFKADKFGHNGKQFSALALCTLHEPYIIPGMQSTAFNDFPFFSIILFDSFLKTLSTCFSCLTAKLNKALPFKFSMVNFF